MITGNSPSDREEFIKKIISHVSRDIRLIQLRAKNLIESDYLELATKVLEATRSYDVKVMLNCSLDCFDQVKAHGLHLTSELLMSLNKRPLPDHYIVSAACHNIEQLKQAESIGVDFVALSPVLQTKTHPEAKPLGWELFSKLCQSTKVPVYALGGLTQKHLEQVISLGAYGIAAIHSLWDREY